MTFSQKTLEIAVWAMQQMTADRLVRSGDEQRWERCGFSIEDCPNPNFEGGSCCESGQEVFWFMRPENTPPFGAWKYPVDDGLAVRDHFVASQDSVNSDWLTALEELESAQAEIERAKSCPTS